MLFKPAKLSVEEIVATVCKSSAYERADRVMKEAADAHNAAVAETRKAIAANGDQNNSAEVNRRAALENSAEKTLRDAHAKVVPLRTEHGAKVAEALRPLREAAATRVLEILGDLAPEIRTLIASMQAIESLGGSCVRMPPTDLQDIEHVARRIVGTAAPAEED